MRKSLLLSLFLFFTGALIGTIGHKHKEKIYDFIYDRFFAQHEDLSDGDYEIVVARYKENLDWIKDRFPIQDVTVYNKGPDDIKLESNVKIKKIENVGREANTYLYHIVKNFNQLKKRVIFIQGNPFDHKGAEFIEKIKNNKLKKSYYARSIIASNDQKWTTESLIKNDQTSLTKEALKDTPWKNSVFRESNTLEEFTKRYNIALPEYGEVFNVSWGAQFLVKREDILKHPLKYYEDLLNSVSHSIAPIEGHYFERLWDLVF